MVGSVAGVPAAEACSTKIDAGDVISGGVVSTTVTVLVADELRPDTSVAVKVTTVAPGVNMAGAS